MSQFENTSWYLLGQADWADVVAELQLPVELDKGDVVVEGSLHEVRSDEHPLYRANLLKRLSLRPVVVANHQLYIPRVYAGKLFEMINN